MKVSVLVVAIGLVGGRGGMAADSAEAEALISQGVELRQQGRDEKALPLFQKAYGLVPSPRTAGQLGFAEMAVGYWLDAKQHLNEALETPDHPWVKKNHDTINQALRGSAPASGKS
jgi:tetratricopeptide (TPR) repeat protein